MPLTPEEMKGQLRDLKRQLDELKGRGGQDPRVPLLATEFDIEDAVFPPTVHVYHNGPQVIGTGATTTLAFNTERFDTDNMHDTAANTERLTIRTAGKYLIAAHAQWGASPVNGLIIFRHNGTTDIARHSGEGDYRMMALSSPVYEFNVGDYVECRVQQNSGGNLSILYGASYSPNFTMAWQGP